jgi:HK97 family phage major capsid protein
MPTLQELTAELDARDAAIAKKMAAFDGLKAENDELRGRLEDLEARAKTPGSTSPQRGNEESREHRKRFDAWLRRPLDSEAKNALGEFESQLRKKAVTIATPADGGFAVPEEISREIARLEQKLSPVRNLVRVDRVGSNDNKMLVSLRGAAAGWVGESTARTETATPTLRERAPTMGEIYAYPQTTEWALDDAFFDVGAWLAEEVAEEFAIAEGEAVIRGSGTNQPTGMLNTTPVTTGDFASPLRAAAAYQFVPSVSDNSPASAEIQPDALITLLYAVNSRYRANGTWVMNSNTAAAIRKLKDAEGRYLWQPAFMAGQPEQLLGYPVAIWEAMDDIATNSFPVAFGDFRKGYRLVDRTEIRITIDANITTPGRVKYYVRRREGGCVLVNDAIKWLRATLS